LKGKEGTVTLSAGGPKEPGLFSHRDTPNLAPMPMFVQWEEAGQGTTPAPAPEPAPAPPETPSASAEPEKARARRKKAKK